MPECHNREMEIIQLQVAQVSPESANFSPNKVAHINPESMAHISPESMAQVSPE